MDKLMIVTALCGCLMMGAYYQSIFYDRSHEPQYQRNHVNEMSIFSQCVEAAPKWSQDGGEIIRQCRAMAYEMTRKEVK